MNQHILYLFTRTPLHVGAGSSVGAIDQPVIRERHTGFPIIPGSSLKGVIADLWNEDIKEQGFQRVTDSGDAWVYSEAAWLFGSDNSKNKQAAAGALSFSEARLLAFPIRSAKGSFAWITSPLILQRAVRDGVIQSTAISKGFNDINDDSAYFGKGSPIDLNDKVILEEYTFKWLSDIDSIGDELSALMPKDPVSQGIKDRLVIISDTMMSFFTQNACQVAQHVKIDDRTGTADGGALFNQENVPSDSLFYALIHFGASRIVQDSERASKTAQDAENCLREKLTQNPVIQLGGDGSTGLGYCGITIGASQI